MRRLPTALWLLAPLAVGLLYAAGHALLAPRPAAGNLVPEEALLVQRFRNMAAVDRCFFGPRAKGLPTPREAIAEARNVPGLPGVDLDGPLHMIMMPRTHRPDSTLAVFALSDADSFERAFERTDQIEKGGMRHAQHLVLRGSWAAVGPSRDAARRVGTGGISAEDLEEDHALAVDVPRLVGYAISLANEHPWRSLLVALGVDVEAASIEADPEKGLHVVTLPGMERALRIGETWKTARMWVWMDAGRLRVELEPQPGRLQRLVSACVTPLPGGALPPVPAEAAIRITTPHMVATLTVIRAIEGCGVPIPAGVLDVPPHMHGATVPTAMLAWAVPTPGSPADLTVGLATAEPEGFGLVEKLLPPESERVHSSLKGHALLAFGGVARRTLDRMGAGGAPNQALTPVRPAPLPKGHVEVATFAAEAKSAARLLGRALLPGGFLACLAGGNIHGTLTTDGAVLRLEVWVER